MRVKIHCCEHQFWNPSSPPTPSCSLARARGTLEDPETTSRVAEHACTTESELWFEPGARKDVLPGNRIWKRKFIWPWQGQLESKSQVWLRDGDSKSWEATGAAKGRVELRQEFCRENVRLAESVGQVKKHLHPWFSCFYSIFINDIYWEYNTAISHSSPLLHHLFQ